MQNHRRSAFALLELLVVLGLILIAAAILFPLFARSRENAKGPSCQNNLKQIALGFKQYINDFNERYPLVFVTSGNSTGVPPYGWADALQPYIKNTQVYQCTEGADSGQDNPTKPSYSDYWYNANLVVFYKGKGMGANESLFGSTAQTILAGHGENANGQPTGDARYNQCGDGTLLTRFGQRCALSPTGMATYPDAQVHLGGSNFAFADGHVKWLRGNNATQSPQVLSNGMTRKSISTTPYSGKVTFSLLNN